MMNAVKVCPPVVDILILSSACRHKHNDAFSVSRHVIEGKVVVRHSFVFAVDSLGFVIRSSFVRVPDR